mgnify:CR=1 FL=1
MRIFAVVKIIRREYSKQRAFLLVVIIFYMCMLAEAQQRIVIVDMETGVPQRNVIVQYGTEASDTTIWDGSVMLDTLAEGFNSRNITLHRSGYMTRTLTSEELADTLELLPMGNALGEVVIYGKYRPWVPGWVMPSMRGVRTPSSSTPGLKVNTDMAQAIDNLFNYKRRKRTEKARKRMSEY